MRANEEKSAVECPSVSLTWGMPLTAARAAMTAAAFTREKIPGPPPSKSPPQKKKPKPKPPAASTAKPPPKEIELAFKKGDAHVQLSIVEKAGLSKVSIGQDVADRQTAERRANEALSGVGTCLSEAETETTAFRDASADVQLSITGFQGQRVVFESYRNPDAEPGTPTAH
jgi:hypothetical protein